MLLPAESHDRVQRLRSLLSWWLHRAFQTVRRLSGGAVGAESKMQYPLSAWESWSKEWRNRKSLSHSWFAISWLGWFFCCFGGFLCVFHMVLSEFSYSCLSASCWEEEETCRSRGFFKEKKKDSLVTETSMSSSCAKKKALMHVPPIYLHKVQHIFSPLFGSWYKLQVKDQCKNNSARSGVTMQNNEHTE